jgi:hypothetical protein
MLDIYRMPAKIIAANNQSKISVIIIEKSSSFCHPLALIFKNLSMRKLINIVGKAIYLK